MSSNTQLLYCLQRRTSRSHHVFEHDDACTIAKPVVPLDGTRRAVVLHLLTNVERIQWGALQRRTQRNRRSQRATSKRNARDGLRIGVSRPHQVEKHRADQAVPLSAQDRLLAIYKPVARRAGRQRHLAPHEAVRAEFVQELGLGWRHHCLRVAPETATVTKLRTTFDPAHDSMATQAPTLTPIQSADDLLSIFASAEKPRARWRVGTEAEKFAVFSSGAPIGFRGDEGITYILRELAAAHGWHAQSEYSGGETISLLRGNSSITLEPGGQIELSGAPQDTIHQTCAEFRGHMAELRSIGEKLDIHWLGLGFHPFATQDELPWVPKLRYAVMREYLPTRGSMALDMMRRTATVQANFDFESERDAMRKLRLALRIQPVVTAMFANSPFAERAHHEDSSHRARCWLNMDPDRSGLLPFAWNEKATYGDYIDWALDVPMFLVLREGQTVRNTGQTFRDFWQNGFEGHQACIEDWATHLATLFPEVRLKNTLEVRGADSQSTDLTCALPALWKGLLYTDDSLDALEALTEHLDYETVENARPAIVVNALRAELAGRSVQSWAQALLEISRSGLERLSNLSRSGKDESIHLKKLESLAAQGRCPADDLRDKVRADEHFVADVLEHARI